MWCSTLTQKVSCLEKFPSDILYWWGRAQSVWVSVHMCMCGVWCGPLLSMFLPVCVKTQSCLCLRTSASLFVCAAVYECITASVTSHRCRCALTVCWVSLAGESFLVLPLCYPLLCTGTPSLGLWVLFFFTAEDVNLLQHRTKIHTLQGLTVKQKAKCMAGSFASCLKQIFSKICNCQTHTA